MFTVPTPVLGQAEPSDRLEEGTVGRAPRRAVAAVLIGMSVVLAGCTVGPSQRPPVAVRGENMPGAPTATPAPPAPPALPDLQDQKPAIDFYDCTELALEVTGNAEFPVRTVTVDCGALLVPEDREQPGRGAATLGVARVGLKGARLDRPPLLVLADSASEASLWTAVRMAMEVDPTILDRYTLVGLDRRGSGENSLSCSPGDDRAALVGADIGATNPAADLDYLLERARTIVQECTILLDGGIGNYRTTASSGDVEQLRTALGVDRLSAVGYGDGAAALAGWARTSPQSVGRLVLDGPPDAALDEPQLSEARAKSAEAAFTAFAQSCAARPDCPLGADPRAATAALVARLTARPLVNVDGRRLTAGAALTTILSTLEDPVYWPELEPALAEAVNGDPFRLLSLLDPLASSEGRFDSVLATSCNDTRRRLAPAEIADLAGRWRTEYPLFGSNFARHLIMCAPWPTGGPAPASGPADGAPPIIVIGGAADPRSPFEGTRATADSLATARFVSWQGAGTGAYPRTPCVRGIVDAALLNAVVPDTGLLCPP